MSAYTIGLDFGTESVRALVVNARSGETVAAAIESYGDGVIDEALPGSGERLPPDWALQNPADWLTGLERTITSALARARLDPADVVGIGIDFTSCTVLPAAGDGTPLCELEAFSAHRHAWPKLWKHHGAQKQADRITAIAAERREPWLPRYGGRISSEWLLPKALEVADEAPGVYAAADRFIEAADWVVWRLTGVLARNACAAGYKGTWHKREGPPSRDYMEAVRPGFSDLFERKALAPIVSPGSAVGMLTPEWSARLGLSDRVVVAAPIIDAHAAVLGGGVAGPGTFVMMMGTSTCHLLMAETERPVEGMAGVVEDGIVPGCFAYESGQAAVGDLFGWFAGHAVPPAYHAAAAEQGLTMQELLTSRAQGLGPGQSGLLVLDWWQGNRSTLGRSDLTGLIAGATLGTRAEDTFHALIEATAFGTRAIIESYTDQHLPVSSIVAGGGLTRNALLMQIYADVTGRSIAVAGAPQASALGAAMLGAAAAGLAGRGHDPLRTAALAMAPPPARVYHPIAGHRAQYDMLYREYKRLYDHFGRGGNDVMSVLRNLRGRGAAAPSLPT
ncbi:MAG: L-ribulokinase [Acidobacteriota bacterium]